eukprot:m.105284 g.105284  ORF g.105284 m.105284 type:complete len:121 (-) comp13277_c0_seq5:1987-2349(-)
MSLYTCNVSSTALSLYSPPFFGVKRRYADTELLTLSTPARWKTLDNTNSHSLHQKKTQCRLGLILTVVNIKQLRVNTSTKCASVPSAFLCIVFFLGFSQSFTGYMDPSLADITANHFLLC